MYIGLLQRGRGEWKGRFEERGPDFRAPSKLPGLRGPRDSVGWDTDDGKRGSLGRGRGFLRCGSRENARKTPPREIPRPFPPTFIAKAQLRHSYRIKAAFDRRGVRAMYWTVFFF